jgi:predicted RND superfamily exporter protein
VDPAFERGLVTVFLKNANFVDTAHLMDSIRVFERSQLAPDRIRLGFAGDVAVSQTLIQAIVHSQMSSLLASLLGILAVIAVLFRSLRWGLICMVPAGLSVAATFALMGMAGMPLGVATSMFAGMVLGIGVDFAIHIAERFRLAVARGAGRDAAILDSLTATGPAIVINALAVALGFGILVLSRVPANAQLGAITVVSLITCLAATLLVIPALLRLGPK